MLTNEETSHKQITDAVKSIANATNSILINPNDFLCSSDICPYFSNDYAIYANNHLNIEFVGKYITYLDEYLLVK